MPDGEIEIRTGSPTGPVIGRTAVPVTGGWQTYVTLETPLVETSGVQNLYLVYNVAGSNEDSASGALFNFNWAELVIKTEATSNVTETPVDGTSVSLSWDAVTNATGYVIKRSTTPGGPYITVGSTSGLTYTDTGLTAGVEYRYVIETNYGSFVDGVSGEIVAVASNPIVADSLEFGPSSTTSNGADGNVFNFSVTNSEPGHMYQAQESGSLELDDWSDMGVEIPGNGGSIDFSMPMEESHSRHFYRLKIRRR